MADAASPITVHSLKVIGLAAPIIAAVVTLVRLFERIRSRRFSYDDGFAAFSLAILVIFVVALFIHLGDPTNLSHATRVAMYYLLSQGFYGVVWTARLSILFSVIRITPPGSLMKRLLYVLVASFVVIWVILFAQVFWVCENQPGWKETPSPQCALGRDVAIAQLISDIYADSVLIVAPLRLLWNLEVSRAQRNRLLVVFSSSIVTSIASLIHAYYVLRVGGLVEVFVAIVEICISLLICNLAVIVGLGARLFETQWSKSHSGSSGGGESYGMSRSSRHATSTIGGRSIAFRPTRTTEEPLNIKVNIDLHTNVDAEAAYPADKTPDGKGYLYPVRDIR